MISHAFVLILQQTLIITAFVLGMMMIIEFINVRTRGLWSKKLQASPWIQILVCAIMGIIPGCLGTYTAVSLYVHRVVNFPALMAALIATTGDESFFMFSLFPRKALIITAILFILSIITGFVLQTIMKNKFVGLKKETSFPLHDNEHECGHTHHHIKSNLKNITFVRALLITGCVSIILLIIGGFIDGSHQLSLLMGGQNEETVIESFEEHNYFKEKTATVIHDDYHHDTHSHQENGKTHHHDHGGEADWIRYTLLVMFSIILIIVIVAKEHFLEEHLWEHVIKVHLPKIFLWTFGVIAVLTILNQYINIQEVVSSNTILVLTIALLVGIIPQSGPHLLFVLLFAQGSIPVSILLANSIVQDGHGTLPLLAESRKAFFLSKGVSIIIGALIGIAGLIFGF